MKTFLIIFLAAAASLAQTGKIGGRITDEENHPIPGASVLINGSNKGDAADENGYFIIENLDKKEYEITISALGYKRADRIVNISEGNKQHVQIKLQVDVLSFSDIIIKGERNYSASSSADFNRIDFELRPRESAQDMLEIVPGLITAQHAGGGKAEQIFLRGFDADHGTDVNITVDGMPVNMVSHAHGQGYADLHFVIPEVVKSLDVQKGPYFVSNGDFSTAGSLNLRTIDRLNRNSISIERGSFNKWRGLGIFNLPFNSASTSTYIAGEYLKTDGYFNSPQNFHRYNLFGKLVSDISNSSTLKLSASAFGSTWDASGQIPQRAVEEGIVDRFGSIDDTEGGNTKRLSLNAEFNKRFDNESYLETQAYFFSYYFNLFSNFTFYLNDPVNGDQIQQVDDRKAGGYKAAYNFFNRLGDVNLHSTIGTSMRHDFAKIQLWNTTNRKRHDPRVIADVNQTSFGVYLQEEIIFNNMFRTKFGLRADHFIFNVTDKLTEENSGKKNQTVFSPKINFVFSPKKNLDFFLNLGSGFHSNDARVVVLENDKQTLPRAIGGEIGNKIKPFGNIFLTTSFWFLDLENEFVYVGDEGITELSGATRRIGIDLGIRAKLNEWLWADADLNISRGRFKNEPGGMNYIPLAPTLTSTGGLTAYISDKLETIARYIFINDRPANEDNTVTAEGTLLFNLGATYEIGLFKVGLTVENIFNIDWNEAQFDTETRLMNEPEAVSGLHFTPGTRRNFTFSLTAEF